LGVVVLPLVASPEFEFDGEKGTALTRPLATFSQRMGEGRRPLLHNVTFTIQPEARGEHGQGAEQRDAIYHFVTGEVGVFVDDVAAQSMMIVFKDALDMDECGTPRAKKEMIEGGERDHLTLSAWLWRSCN
jgi:hypothetical protein